LESIEREIRPFDAEKANDLERFAPRYLAMMAIDGSESDAISSRMRRFVNLQTTKISDPPMEINFYGPQCGSFPVRVTSPKDVDFADAHGVSQFVGFCVTRPPGLGPWTDAEIEQLRGHVSADFEADGTEVELQFSILDDSLQVNLALIQQSEAC